jgi:hypothetical protein
MGLQEKRGAAAPRKFELAGTRDFAENASIETVQLMSLRSLKNLPGGPRVAECKY